MQQATCEPASCQRQNPGITDPQGQARARTFEDALPERQHGDLVFAHAGHTPSDDSSAHHFRHSVKPICAAIGT